MEQNLTLFCEEFLKYVESKTPVVVVTLVKAVGHAPQDVGARMVVGLNDRLFGTAGGGKIEKKCIDTAREFLASSEKVESQSFTWNLQRDIGMTCGGEVTYFFEVYKPSEVWKIAIFGAGHISQELTRILLTMDCQLTVIDPRAEWLNKLPDSPRLTKLERTDLVPEIELLDEKTFVAIVTMGHATDYPLVKRALEKRNFPYLGVIGSKVKRIKINADLIESGLSPDRVKEFFCPMGEPIGRNTPPEIAISIAAQMLKVRDQVFASADQSADRTTDLSAD